jgi:opacity protein-like surface antigen
MRRCPGLPVCLLAVWIIAPASAQGFDPSRIYLRGFGGVEFAQGTTANSDYEPADISYTFDYDTGYLLGAAVGYLAADRVAVELEYAWRQADATVNARYEDRFGGVPFGDEWSFDDRVTVQSGMANALYRFAPVGPGGRVAPYAGAGIGVASLDVRGAGHADPAFAWQAIGGVAWAIDPHWSLTGELRWFSTEGGAFLKTETESVDMGFDAFDLIVGASYRF